MTYHEVLQYGALGLLTLVLVGGGRALFPMAQRLIASVDGLRSEIHKMGTRHERLLALLLAQQFGEEKALQILREDEDEQSIQHRPEEGRDQARPG